VETMGQKVITTLESTEESTLPDSEFAIPADYKELNPTAPPTAGPATPANQ